MSELITPVDPQVLLDAKTRVQLALKGKTKGWRGSNHGKTVNGIKNIHVHHLEVAAGDLCTVAQAVLFANPDKIPERMVPNHTIFH